MEDTAHAMRALALTYMAGLDDAWVGTKEHFTMLSEVDVPPLVGRGAGLRSPRLCSTNMRTLIHLPTPSRG